MACAVGCSIENDTHTDLNWREVSGFNSLRHPGLPVFHFSLACNHCTDAPCKSNCPAAAFTRDPETGLIIHHAEACIGCKYCTWACPYDAPKYNPTKGVVEKCTFCTRGLELGQAPACVSACPVGALDFSNKIEPDGANLIPGFVKANARPGIQLKALHAQQEQPVIWNTDRTEISLKEAQAWIPKPSSKVSLKKEWSLAAFTLVLAGMVAWFATHLITGLVLPMHYFIAAGMLGMGLSLFHLGKKLRAYRAILNITSSWLSREIFSFAAFLGLGLVFLLTRVSWMGSAALGFGVLSLISGDLVYRFLKRQDGLPVHSAMISITGLLLFGILSGIPFFIGFSITLKLGLYIFRKIQFRRAGLSSRWISTSIRIISLVFSLISIVLLDALQLNYWIIFSLLLLGEVIDRVEFYQEAEVMNPRGELHSHFKANLR